ncbi:TetR/AcrR family transcriptional regulator [Mycobacterium talmoniae]|uniref:Tetracycline repressor protein class E n=1 Tax=Mycobacterium talmoniae TaxID=1858794 RepID=A0A2S8BFA6_9MYCO|nr:TetR/AcrR family transcriptional regulator [Mycobacterium talmoniae]PQM45357.1 Tetracycline repressor protein class E [Mycobacterium talmoniae]
MPTSSRDGGGTRTKPRDYRNFLTLDAIIAEATAVADADGLEAVSMRVLADRLGCTPRALYRHVSGKDEVLELLADAALGDIPDARTDITWQDSLLDFFVAMRAKLVALPAVATIVAQQAVAGPHFHRHANRLVGILLDAGFDADAAADTVVTLAYYTLGASLPGTGQRLHDTYRVREINTTMLPALAHIAGHFNADSAEHRFRTSLYRLLGTYGP